MCGIAGYISLDQHPVDSSILSAMTLAVAHRGPDDSGTYISGPIGFGHRRLAIVDLSRDGHQPMLWADGRLVLTFNGEIYNYIELREELKARGRSFRTATDSEVILAAYAEWGEACVNRFNGMWAFAIHDVDSGKVFCSRDRFGVKPFYWARTTTVFAFGSEIRQLLPLLPRVRANRDIVVDFLIGGGCEPLEETFFEGVRKLPGGHSMTIDIATGVQTINKYYELRGDPSLETLDADGAACEYGRRLQEATMLRLRSDVRVGTCLSGGLDSSAIAALAAGPYREARGEPFCAITSASEQASNDESAFAEMVVRRANLDWIRIRPVYADFAASLHEIVVAQEEPFDGPSICMQYFVMKAAREAGIPVLLDGQGGDETLLGYNIYFAAFLLSQYHTHGARAAVREFFALRKFAADAKMPFLRLIAHTLYFQSTRMQQFRAASRGRFLRESPKVPASQTQRGLAAREIRALQILEVTKTVLPSLLRYEDKNSMRHSIETRLPFLDYRSVEAAISFAPETKIHHGWTKYPLRKFIDKWLPPQITWRRTKIGFEAPDEIWMRMHKSEMHRAIGESVLVRSLTKPKRFQGLCDSVDKSTLWRLYSVALWEQAFSVT